MNRMLHRYLTASSLLSAVLMLAACDDEISSQGPRPQPPAPQPPAPQPPPQPPAPTEPTPFDLAVSTIGGRDALANLEGLRVTSTGERFDYAESFRPGELHSVGTFSLTADLDLTGGRMRLDWQRQIHFLGAEFMTAYTDVTADRVGMSAGCDSIFMFCTGELLSQRVAAIDKTARLLNPHILLKKAVLEPEAVSAGRPVTLDGVTYQAVVIDDEWQPVTFLVDAESGEIAAAITQEIDHALGDVAVTVRFSDWAEAEGGLKFPQALRLSLGAVEFHTESGRQLEVNPTFTPDLFAQIEGASAEPSEGDYLWGLMHSQWFMRWQATGIALDNAMEFVTADEVVPGSGLYLLGGALHNTLAVELADSIVLVDAPYHDRRSAALLAKIEELWPDKPISHVVLTHFHDDHTGGARGLLSRGGSLVVSGNAEDHWASVLAAPHALEPDLLAQSGATPELVTVAGTGPLVLGSGSGERTVEIWPVANTHAADMLMVYVPHARVLFETDLYSPNPMSTPESPLLGNFTIWSVELIDAIDALQLDVALVAGGHGFIDTIERVRAHIEAQGTRQ